MRPKLPEPYWYRTPLNLASCPTMTREEFVASGPEECEDDDDMISVHGLTNSAFSGFFERRSVLARSPVLAAFFRSDHYLAGTKMGLWFMNDSAAVVCCVLQYMAQPSQYQLPTFWRYRISDRVDILIGLYFLAKRLEVFVLEDMVFESLTVVEEAINEPRVITSMAEIIYEHPSEKDSRIRGFLQRRVEQNLRNLLTDDGWRNMMRDTRPSFAADMFDLVATLLLEGEVTDYPPRLPTPTMREPPVLAPGEKLCAVLIRHFYASRHGQLTAYRGERLRDVEVILNQLVIGTNSVGRRGEVPRDCVELLIEAGPVTHPYFYEYLRSSDTMSPTEDGHAHDDEQPEPDDRRHPPSRMPDSATASAAAAATARPATPPFHQLPFMPDELRNVIRFGSKPDRVLGINVLTAEQPVLLGGPSRHASCPGPGPSRRPSRHRSPWTKTTAARKEEDERDRALY
ncbi:MAG: hypothetical protein M1826_004229 [Phylliscum demangeonii]|nr:MAG: hypothetical protein M1826_004229 [Phylliscum demangeonii]